MRCNIMMLRRNCILCSVKLCNSYVIYHYGSIFAVNNVG